MEMFDRSKLVVAAALTLAVAIGSVTYAQNAPQGAQTPSQGAQTPAQGAQTPAQGAQTPAQGAQTPSQGADESSLPRMGRTSICLRRDGRTSKSVCRVVGTGTSRMDSCRCSQAGSRMVNVSICGPGMRPNSEDSAFRSWRSDTVAQTGTLVGTQFQGQPVCVRRR
jgi:hypothetical protein